MSINIKYRTQYPDEVLYLLKSEDYKEDKALLDKYLWLTPSKEMPDNGFGSEDSHDIFFYSEKEKEEIKKIILNNKQEIKHRIETSLENNNKYISKLKSRLNFNKNVPEKKTSSPNKNIIIKEDSPKSKEKEVSIIINSDITPDLFHVIKKEKKIPKQKNPSPNNQSPSTTDCSLLRKKRGRKKKFSSPFPSIPTTPIEKESKKKVGDRKQKEHLRNSPDNIFRKIQVHYISFLRDIVNRQIEDYLFKNHEYFKNSSLRKFIQTESEYYIKRLDYNIISKINKNVLSSLKSKTIKQILSQNISNHYKTISQNINELICGEICEKNKLGKFILNKKYFDYYEIFISKQKQEFEIKDEENNKIIIYPCDYKSLQDIVDNENKKAKNENTNKNIDKYIDEYNKNIESCKIKYEKLKYFFNLDENNKKK